MSKYQAVRGTKDILPAFAKASAGKPAIASATAGEPAVKLANSAEFQMLEAVARDVFQRFGFGEIRTPTFEALDLFQRSIGETTDVVQKEMYVFEDRGGRKLALRPEGTAGVVRAFIEHHLSQTMPFCKLFYVGPMFRAERPQAGRYREFWQIGGEYFGNASPYADAELLIMITRLFQALGLVDFKLKLNNLGDKESRAAYRQALLTYLESRLDSLCEDCRQRIQKNPLRALDCKVDGPHLVDAPTVDASWTPAARAHFEKVQALLTAQGCAFEVHLRLVRGLDYYNGTVFEVTSNALGAQNALAGGGRYDTLVKEMDGPDMPAIGFALGVERTIEVLRTLTSDSSKPNAKPVPLVFVAAQGAGAAEAFRLLEELRTTASASFKVEGGFFEKKLGAQLGYADRLGATQCLIIGDDEVAKAEVTLRDLKTGVQTRFPIAEAAARLAAL